jgi:hypothetical protein
MLGIEWKGSGDACKTKSCQEWEGLWDALSHLTSLCHFYNNQTAWLPLLSYYPLPSDPIHIILIVPVI